VIVIAECSQAVREQLRSRGRWVSLLELYRSSNASCKDRSTLTFLVSEDPGSP